MYKILFFFCLISTSASAQLIDMRARSIRAGHSREETQSVPQRRPSPIKYNHSPSNDVALAKQNPAPARLRQGQLKMFKPEDEAKVLNFRIDNPDFDRLSDEKKQDIIRRISIEEK